MPKAPTASAVTLSRRTVIALTANAATLALTPLGALAQGGGAWSRVDEALAIVGDADPIAEGVVLDLPAVSEDGSTVPLGVSVDRPMQQGEFVKAIHIIAPGNPYPLIATFNFTELSGRPEVETRVRLNESQTVIALVELSSGAMLVGERDVRVTVSGCLARADTYDTANLFTTRVRVPESLAAGESGEVLTMINHPQESGLRESMDGGLVPKRLIERMDVTLDGEPVFSADLHRSVSSNPYIKFFMTPQSGGTLDFTWTEDTGETAHESAELAV
ncbi:thiosulfate oxidation carrier protein SoxY [Pelagibacterium montanilacus]|uniref:thiosulfate oxidation carrier protein SoxY n=1 Tax=Pelagibacterium montanilacus TaxID=2185280 RepID=UPI0013DEA192|nr:thiosulfate oxidation carrier protein SoxY [Pelagibacterium montanilacus]